MCPIYMVVSTFLFRVFVCFFASERLCDGAANRVSAPYYIFINVYISTFLCFLQLCEILESLRLFNYYTYIYLWVSFFILFCMRAILKGTAGLGEIAYITIINIIIIYK